MSTGVFVAEGEKASDADVVNYASTYSCVMTGTVKHGKSVETIIDDDTWKLEMYDINEDGTEWKAFELLYKRVE